MKTFLTLVSTLAVFNSALTHGADIKNDGPGSTMKVSLYSVNFDDLHTSKIPIPYQGLGYSGLKLTTLPSDSLLQARSSCNVALHEPAKPGSKTPAAINPQLTVVYPKSVIMAFHFKWVYFACYKLGTKNYVPKPCKIEIIGSDMNRKVAMQPFTYSPATSRVTGQAGMVKAVFGKGFITVTNITVALADAKTNFDTGLALDNFEYAGYSFGLQ